MIPSSTATNKKDRGHPFIFAYLILIEFSDRQAASYISVAERFTAP